MDERYFVVQELENDGDFLVPKVFFMNEAYSGLSAAAMLAWSILLDLQRVCYRKGWVDKRNRVYFVNPQNYLETLFRKGSEADVTCILQELESFHLLEKQENRYYLVKPKLKHDMLMEMDKLKLLYISEVNEQTADTSHNSRLLKKFLYENNIRDETIINELYNKCVLTNHENLLSYHDILEIYENLLEKKSSREQQKSDENNNMEKAIYFVDRFFGPSEIKQLTNSNKLVLYRFFNKIQWLHSRGLFSLSFILTLKTKYALSSNTFNAMLEEAFLSYKYDESELVDFADFFELVIIHHNVINKKAKLVEEIDTKLFALPGPLKKFVFELMKKYEEKYPERYELVLNNLRIINTIYQDFEDLPDSVFKKAFRRLFADHKVHNVHSYFLKGIKLAQKEIKEKDTKEKKESTNENDQWLQQLIRADHGENSIEQMDETEKEEYFERAQMLKNKLKMLNQTS